MNEKAIWETIKDNPYCDPSRRMDFVLLFDVKDGNPNGDPDAGNLPRVDPTTRKGIVTDVCIKRKVRDYLAMVLERPIYIQSKDALNTLYFRAAREVPEAKQHVIEVSVSMNFLKDILTGTGKGKNIEPSDDQIEAVREGLAELDVEGLEYLPECETITYLGEAKTKQAFEHLMSQEKPEALSDEAISRLAQALFEAKRVAGGKLSEEVRDKVKTKMCQLYDDIRLFGAVLTAGTNAGQVRGPLQLTFGRSLTEILPQDAAITRCAITREIDRSRKQTEFGRKPWLSYAAYRQHGFFNPLLGDGERGTGVTRDDLARFWEALAGMFPNSASASKGEMATQDLVVFVHRSSRGNAPTHRLFEKVRIQNGASSPRLAVDDEQTINDLKIEVCRPLKDLWGNLQEKSPAT